MRHARCFEVSPFSKVPLVNVYDEIASAYDEVMGDDFSRITFGPLCQEIVRHRKGVPIARHLDLASGTGTFACKFSKQTGARSFGIEMSSAQLQVARAKAHRMKAARVTFVRGDVVSTDFPRSLDVVTMTFDALNHIRRVEDWAGIFKKASAALTPGGILAFDVNTPHRLLNDWNVPEVIVKPQATYIQIGLSPEVQENTVRRRILMRVYWQEANRKIRCGHAIIEQVAIPWQYTCALLRASGFSRIKRILTRHELHRAHAFLRHRDFILAIR